MEAVIGHLIDLPGQDIIHILQEVVTRVIPLFGRYLDEPFRDNVQGVTRELPRSSSVKA